MKKANETNTERKELVELCALWKHKGNSGEYLSGQTVGDSSFNVVGFFNTNKKNPNEPDVRIYEQTDKGSKLENEIIALWENISKNGNKYLTGNDNEGKKVVAFYGDVNEEKRPFVRIYYK